MTSISIKPGFDRVNHVSAAQGLTKPIDTLTTITEGDKWGPQKAKKTSPGPQTSCCCRNTQEKFIIREKSSSQGYRSALKSTIDTQGRRLLPRIHTTTSVIPSSHRYYSATQCLMHDFYRRPLREFQKRGNPKKKEKDRVWFQMV